MEGSRETETDIANGCRVMVDLNREGIMSVVYLTRLSIDRDLLGYVRLIVRSIFIVRASDFVCFGTAHVDLYHGARNWQVRANDVFGPHDRKSQVCTVGFTKCATWLSVTNAG
jgi:hypothetical protein